MSGARIFYTDHFVLPLPPGHRFPMEKYARLRARVASELDVDGLLDVPAAADDAALLRVHQPPYLHRVVTGTLDAAAIRRIGFPWSPAMVERARRSVGATMAACRAALEWGIGVNLAGGTHHAYAGRGEGYCVFNDVAVAVRALQAAGAVRRVLIVDLDVHQGNGTAATFAGEPEVTTLDLYGAGNFPFEKEHPDIDAPLSDGTGDATYLETLEAALARGFGAGSPDLLIYVAGADPYEHDRLGRLALSKAGLRARDASVLDAARHRGIPVVVVMAGGYAKDVEDTVDIHFATVEAALTSRNAPSSA